MWPGPVLPRRRARRRSACAGSSPANTRAAHSAVGQAQIVPRRRPSRRAFAAHEIVPLKGDWTRQDPEITTLLQKFGRSGVPLYLLYDRGGSPHVLPQILTEATILDAIGRI